MKTPELCPICQEVLTYQFGYINKERTTSKHCQSRLDHSLKLRLNKIDQDQVSEVLLYFGKNKGQMVHWSLSEPGWVYCLVPLMWHDEKTGKLIVNYTDVLPAGTSPIKLPFFIPRLDRFPQLIEKINTCLNFK